jgi:hypothetical protein
MPEMRGEMRGEIRGEIKGANLLPAADDGRIAEDGLFTFFDQ